MFVNDYIMRQIELLGKGVRVLVGAEEAGGGGEMISQSGELSGELFLLHRLRQLLFDNKIGEAEDLLFENLERDRTGEYFAAAVEFYAEVQKKSDAQLTAGGFSREEIAEGLEDVRKLREKHMGRKN